MTQRDDAQHRYIAQLTLDVDTLIRRAERKDGRPDAAIDEDIRKKRAEWAAAWVGRIDDHGELVKHFDYYYSSERIPDLIEELAAGSPEMAAIVVTFRKPFARHNLHTLLMTCSVPEMRRILW